MKQAARTTGLASDFVGTGVHLDPASAIFQFLTVCRRDSGKSMWVGWGIFRQGCELSWHFSTDQTISTIDYGYALHAVP